MRFAVTKVCGGGGKARAGALHVGGICIETPALLLSTRKGLPAFVSCDLLASLPIPDSLLLHVCPTHFMEGPPSKTISNIGGLHGMVGLPNHILVAAAGDSIESLPSSDATNKFGASFETPSGRRLVKPTDYMELISCMKPNLWASLADEIPAWSTEKRNKISVDRTLRWLDACLALDTASGTNTLGVVVGGSSIEQRRLCATEVSKRNVTGFWIGGFGLGESTEERCSLLNAVTDCLPSDKPRLVSRLDLPGTFTNLLWVVLRWYSLSTQQKKRCRMVYSKIAAGTQQRLTCVQQYTGKTRHRLLIAVAVSRVRTTLGLTSIICSMSMRCWLRSYWRYIIPTITFAFSVLYGRLSRMENLISSDSSLLKADVPILPLPCFKI